MTASPSAQTVPDGSPSEEEVTPAIYHHCVTVYNAMFKEAKPVVVPQTESDEDDDVDARSILVYEGHLTRLFQKLHLSVPYYTSVTQNLKRMGCIAQLRRGGGSAPSQWQLIMEPDEEAFRDAILIRRKSQGKDAMLEQQIRDLNLRVSTLEELVQVMINGGTE